MAGTKTKRPQKRSKKKKNVESEKDSSILMEYKSFKIGDKVWCVTVSGKIMFVTIHRFHPNDKPIPSVGVYDEKGGSGYRTVAFNTLSETKIVKKRQKK